MKLRSMVLATCSVLFATTAQAAPGVGGGTLQVCDSDSVPNMTTGWMDSVTLARFDPDLGILTGVDVKLEATITGAASFESLSSKPTTLTTTFSALMTVFRPGGTSALVSVSPSQSFVTSVPAFDGTIDFGGPSGQSFTNLSETRTATFHAPPPPSDLALFTGPAGAPGTLTLPVVVNGTSTGSGAGGLILQFSQSGSAVVEVCYEYALDCNHNGIPDDVDVAGPTSDDLDGNGVPDECETLPPVVEYCFGDGLGRPCPCGNDDVLNPATGGCLNSTGNGARLTTNGLVSVSADDLRFDLVGGVPTALAVLTSADNALASGLGILGLPPSDGLRCVGGNALRHGGRGLDALGATATSWGNPLSDPSRGLIDRAGFVAGQTRHFQVRYRDHAGLGCGSGIDTSQALALTFEP